MTGNAQPDGIPPDDDRLAEIRQSTAFTFPEGFSR